MPSFYRIFGSPDEWRGREKRENNDVEFPNHEMKTGIRLPRCGFYNFSILIS